MSKKSAKHSVSDKTHFIDKYAALRTMVLLFVVATVFSIVLLYAYSRNNKETASRLVYEAAYQRAEGLKNALNLEYSHLEALAKALPEDKTQAQNIIDLIFAAGDYRGLSGSVYVKGSDEVPEGRSDIIVLENGDIELSVKWHKEDDKYDFLCANLSQEKLSSFVDNDPFDGKFSVILYEVHSGNVVLNTAKKHGFEGNKIGFLLNHTFENGYSARDVFSDIDDGKSGYTEIKAKNASYSVCYVPVTDSDLYVLAFVPEFLVYPDLPRSIVVALAVSLFVVLALVLFNVFEVIKKINDDREKREFSFEVVQTALQELSCDEGVGIYVYRKASDELDIIKDINSDKGKITVNDGFSYLVKKTGVDETDKRKLKNAINLSGPGKDMQINVISKFEKENVNTLMTFSCIGHYPENPKALVCVVKRNDANVKEPVNSKESLTFDGNNTTCIELFLERNIWHFLWSNEPVFENRDFIWGMQNNYDEQLKKDIIPFIKASDREKVQTALDRLSLLCAFRNGELERNVVFGISDNDGHFSKRCLDVRIYRDNYNDEIKANFYIRNILVD